MSDEPQMPEPQVPAVVKVARDLREILELDDALLTQAVHKANDALMPGGLAMVNLGVAANMEAWENMQQATERYGNHPVQRLRRVYTSIDDEDPDESWSTFQLLEFWSEAWRTEHDMEFEPTPHRPRPTVASEANFIRWALDWAWDNEPHWDDFARDIATARTRLEATLYAGERAERSRVVCDRCEEASRLLKVYGMGSEPDRWKCPTCKHKFEQDEFLDAHARQLRHESAAKFVLRRDAIGTLVTQGRSERTIRKWLAPPIRHVEDRCAKCRRKWAPAQHEICPCGGALKAVKRGNPEAVVEGYCDIATRQTWIWWPDLWRLHLTTAQRRREVA